MIDGAKIRGQSGTQILHQLRSRGRAVQAPKETAKALGRSPNAITGLYSSQLLPTPPGRVRTLTPPLLPPVRGKSWRVESCPFRQSALLPAMGKGQARIPRSGLRFSESATRAAKRRLIPPRSRADGDHRQDPRRRASGPATAANPGALMTTLPDLATLAREAPLEELPAWVGRLAEAQAVALARLAGAHSGRSVPRKATERPTRTSPPTRRPQRLGVSRDYLYRNARRLPFSVRIGRRVLFSAQGPGALEPTKTRTALTDRYPDPILIPCLQSLREWCPWPRSLRPS